MSELPSDKDLLNWLDGPEAKALKLHIGIEEPCGAAQHVRITWLTDMGLEDVHAPDIRTAIAAAMDKQRKEEHDS